MAHALRSNAYRGAVSAGFHPPGWWLPGLGAALIVTLVAIGASALNGTNDDEEASQGIAIAINAPATKALPGPQAQTIASPLESAVPKATELSQPPVVAAPVPHVTAAGVRTDIRDVDLAALPVVQALAAQLRGRLDASAIKYVDLTGDGRDEAIVPVTSDGTFGNLGTLVFTQTSDGPQEILTRLSGLDRKGPALSFEAGQLIETVGSYGPSDANCCPGHIARTYFLWDGNRLVVARTEIVFNPNSKQAN